ncbi:hypothetical protein BDZ97DRAFT_1782810 [Flammula alnicola]|nr:hypothetical protein BDZ97DRAFT_1782810 [Flammula alnicola]
MLLMPPRDAPNQRPLYRITVELDLNPLLPVSYVTKVVRCGGDDSNLVGEFAINNDIHPSILLFISSSVQILNSVFQILFE